MSKLISVSDEVYEKLKMRKNGNSFTGVINGLIEEKRGGNIMSFAGAFKDDKPFLSAMDEIMRKRKDFKLKRAGF